MIALIVVGTSGVDNWNINPTFRDVLNRLMPQMGPIEAQHMNVALQVFKSLRKC